jgi:hypothetical protein
MSQIKLVAITTCTCSERLKEMELNKPAAYPFPCQTDSSHIWAKRELSMALNPVVTIALHCDCHSCSTTKGIMFTVALSLPLKDDSRFVKFGSSLCLPQAASNCTPLHLASTGKVSPKQILIILYYHEKIITESLLLE